MFCRICGEQIPDNAKFCPKCGKGTVSLSKNGKKIKMPKAVKKTVQGREGMNTEPSADGCFKAAAGINRAPGQMTWRQRRRQKRLKWEMAHPTYNVSYNIGNFGMLAGIIMCIAGWFISNDLAGILGKVWSTLSNLFNGSTSMAGILKEVIFGKHSEMILDVAASADRLFSTSFEFTLSMIFFVGIMWVIVLLVMIEYALVKNVRGLTNIYVLKGVMIVFFIILTLIIYACFGSLTDVSEGVGFNVFLIGSIVILVSFLIEVMLDRNAISKQKNRVID